MYITSQDLNALVELLNRLPKSRAENLWALGFIERLGLVIQQQKKDDHKEVEDAEGNQD